MEIVKKAGRPAGSKNIATAEIRDAFRELVECNLSKLQDDLDSLEPIERLKMIMQLAKFILPTLKATDLRSNGETVVIDIREYNIPDIGNR